MLKADGFDKAVIGVGANPISREEILVYDAGECVNILMERDGMDDEEAMDYFCFNVQDAYVGESTPMFVWRTIDGEETPV